jgi:hypothetical protein
MLPIQIPVPDPGFQTREEINFKLRINIMAQLLKPNIVYIIRRVMLEMFPQVGRN